MKLHDAIVNGGKMVDVGLYDQIRLRSHFTKMIQMRSHKSRLMLVTNVSGQSRGRHTNHKRLTSIS